jgi:CMP-N-acetylneuraminic acid synthetase
MAQKKIKDILFVIQSRIDSKRLPGKMLLPFCDTNLFSLSIEKILKSSILPRENFYVSLYDEELIEIAEKYGVNIFKRSKESVSESTDTRVVSEWHKLPYKYFITINACCPLLSIKTIDSFIQHFLESPHESLFAVHENKNFYWNQSRQLITEYPGTLDTKLVENTYEAAHCLYAGSTEKISKGIYLGSFTKNDPELFVVNPKETFDIDLPWHFKAAEILYTHKEKFINE